MGEGQLGPAQVVLRLLEGDGVEDALYADLLGPDAAKKSKGLPALQMPEISIGAALLAGVGAGVWPDVDAASAAAIQLTGRTEPDGEAVEKYNRVYAEYRRLYPALKPSFENLAEL